MSEPEEITNPGIIHPDTETKDETIARLLKENKDLKDKIAGAGAHFSDGPSAELEFKRESKSGLHNETVKATIYWKQAKGVMLAGGGAALLELIHRLWAMRGH